MKEIFIFLKDVSFSLKNRNGKWERARKSWMVISNGVVLMEKLGIPGTSDILI